jgi:phage terminase large subunit GpA-like protein
MDAANDKDVRVCVLMWASQTTKTTLLENVAGYHIHADPAPQLIVQPTVEMAEAWSKERFNSTVRDTPALRDLVADQKSRDSGNTIHFKSYPGGNLAIIGANSPAGLAGRPRRVVLLDEVDRFPSSAGTEGDPVSLAARRTESFHNAIIYLTSTPTVKGFSRIEAEFEQTDKRYWFVPCPACGKWQTLKWSGVRWNKAEDGSHQPETAYYQCEHCAGHWTDDLRRQAIKAGEWRPTAPFNGKRGYHLNGIYSPFKHKRGYKSRLHQMVVEFLEYSHGGEEQLRTWVNTFLAETFEPPSEKVDATGLANRAEPYTPEALPEKVLLVVAGADVQEDRIELEYVGLGKFDETWAIEAVRVYGDTHKPETWSRLSHELNRRFRRVDGFELRCVAIGIDTHFRPTIVRDWLKKHGTHCLCYGVFGIGQRQQEIVQSRHKKNWGLTMHSVSGDMAKDVIFSRLRVTEQGPRYCHFPRGYGYTEEWFAQLTSEKVVKRFRRGFPVRTYEKLPHARNEALDMRVYALAAAEILRPQYDEIEAAQRKMKAAPKPEQHAHAPVARRRGWITG